MMGPMKKTVLAWSALAALSFTAIVPAWADPAPTPTPTWAPLDPTAMALLSKVNGLYYNYCRLGLRRFECRVQLDLLENLKQDLLSHGKDREYKAVGGLGFTLSYDGDKGFQFSDSGFQKTGDARFDGEVLKIVQLARQMMMSYCKTWEAMAFQDAFDLKKSYFRISDTSKGYEVDELRDNLESLQELDDQWKVVEARVTDPSAREKGTVLIRPLYVDTPQGYLVDSLSTDINGGTVVSQTDTEYAMVGPFEMPSIIITDIRMEDQQKGVPADYRLKFTLSAFRVN
jgi:hypothetical protein